MNLDKKKLIVTAHARERAEQFQISIGKLVWMFWNSEEGEVPPNAEKHSKHKEATLYRRNGTHVMIIAEVKDKYTNEDAYLLLTVYDQRMDLPLAAFMRK